MVTEASMDGESRPELDMAGTWWLELISMSFTEQLTIVIQVLFSSLSDSKLRFSNKDANDGGSEVTSESSTILFPTISSA